MSHEVPSSQELTSTSRDLKSLRLDVDLPSSLSGKRILDIGTGTSAASLELGRAGAQVVSLDVRYRSKAETRAASDAAFERVKLFKALQEAFGGNLPGAARMDADLIDREKFFQDFEAEKPTGIYVAGTITALPFGDETFDFVYSVLCLSHFVKYPDLFVKGVSEARRVAKTTVQISPWNDHYFARFTDIPENDRMNLPNVVLQRLEEKGIPHRIQ